jgi:hypothetical protein
MMLSTVCCSSDGSLAAADVSPDSLGHRPVAVCHPCQIEAQLRCPVAASIHLAVPTAVVQILCLPDKIFGGYTDAA